MSPGLLQSRVAEILQLREASAHCVTLRYYANPPLRPQFWNHMH